MSKKRHKSQAKRVRQKLKRQVRKLNLWGNAKVPTDMPSDGLPDGAELQGMDGRGCSLVAAIVIIIACVALAAAHIATNLLV